MPPSVPAGKKDWAPPLVFAEYQLLWMLGRGGMGEVYLGHDKLLDRPVAIKFISTVAPDDNIKEQYLTEARAAARLQHPNVVTVHRVGEIDGRLYIVSEYVRGQTLELVQKPLPWHQALELGIGLTRGLAEAHRRGVLHRDIKPGNAILADNGEIKLLDFGLAKCMDRTGPLPIAAGPSSTSEETIAPTIDFNDPGAVAHLGGQGQKSAASPGKAGELPVVRVPLRASLRGHARQLLMAHNLPSLADASKTSGTYRRIAVTSSIKGTPMYMAPEVLTGLTATRRSDVYSMGALLFELCASVPPYYDVPLDQLQKIVPSRDAPPLVHIAPAVDVRFASVIDRCLKRNAAERYASGEELLEALEQLLSSAVANVPDGNPYRGLWPFEDNHRALFFGRRGEIGTLLGRMHTESCVVIAAESGIGKTSLCRAGILPLIKDGTLDNSSQWRIATLTIGRQPMRALVSALAPALEISENELQILLAADPLKLGNEIAARLPWGSKLLFFVDQLEELLTCCSLEEARAVSQALGALLSPRPQIRMLITVRSDQVSRVGVLPGLGEAMLRYLYILRPLSSERLREIVVSPALALGVRFEPSSLIDELVDFAAQTDGGLPLLQLTLAELWESREGTVISQATVDSIGGIRGALFRHADHVIGSMLADRRLLARRVLCTLMSASKTPIHSKESELLALDPAMPAVLDMLVRTRLVFARNTADGAIYEIAHTTLLSDWPSFQRWLTEFETVPGREPPTGAQIAAESHPAESGLKRRNWRYLLPIAGIFLGVAAYAGSALHSHRTLARQVDGYVQQGQRELVVARGLQEELRQLQDRALMAVDQQHSDEAEQLLTRAHGSALAADRAYSRASHQLEMALTVAGGRNELRETLADILYERALIAEADQQEGLLEDHLQRLVLYDVSSRYRQRWTRPGYLRITSVPASASVEVIRYGIDGQKRLAAATTVHLGSTPLPRVELEPGHYILIVSAPGFVTRRHPILIQRAEDIEQQLILQKLSPGP